MTTTKIIKIESASDSDDSSSSSASDNPVTRFKTSRFTELDKELDKVRQGVGKKRIDEDSEESFENLQIFENGRLKLFKKLTANFGQMEENIYSLKDSLKISNLKL